jgi:protein-tyrosine phosphatase
MEIFEVIPDLLIGTRLASTATYEALHVDAIVDLENWAFGWVPRVPTGSIYLSLPMEDDDRVDPRVVDVAAFVAALLRSGGRVLVHCTEGLNRSGVVVARALIDLGWSSADAIELVRLRRGPTEDGFLALANPHFVEWLRSEEDRGRELPDPPLSGQRNPKNAP